MMVKPLPAAPFSLPGAAMKHLALSGPARPGFAFTPNWRIRGPERRLRLRMDIAPGRECSFGPMPMEMM